MKDQVYKITSNERVNPLNIVPCDSMTFVSMLLVFRQSSVSFWIVNLICHSQKKIGTKRTLVVTTSSSGWL